MSSCDENTESAQGASLLGAFDPADAPTVPGCYLMRDTQGKVLYVGKAKNLRARLRNYVNETDGRYQVRFLVRRATQVELLATNNEKEALLLENSLIKQYKPPYNVQLRDDKTYLSLRLDPREDFPRVTVVRRYKKDGARYFGPYHSALAIRQTLKQIHRMFPLRTCSDNVMQGRSRPCLYYQMKQCLAPCVGLIDRAAYHDITEQVALILDGRTADLEKLLLEKIRALAAELRFEEAAVLRDRLNDLRVSTERQRTVAVAGVEDRDVFGYYREGRFIEIQVLFYRGGKMLGGRAFSFEHCETPIEELFGSFLLQYYGGAPYLPAEVLIPVELEEAATLAELLTEQRGTKVTVHYPQRGDKRALTEMANKNAALRFAEKRMTEKADADALDAVRAAFGMTDAPQRIECFDISTMQGDNTVASMVVFTGGKPDKARYRRFTIKAVAGQDDFASMREVLLRRYARAIAEDDLPDLLLVDGGKGQLGVAHAVLHDLGIEDLPHAGIAKARSEKDERTFERFFLPGRANPIVPPQHGPVVRLLTSVRDEAHRFAITYHRKRRDKATLRTALTDIPGIGPARAKSLLNKFGGIATIKEASVEEIAATPGLNARLARVVVEALSAR